MAQALLGGLLPAVFSGADQLKRGVYGLLTNPQEQAERAAQSLLQSRAERQALMARTFANPERPFQVTDQAGLSQLTDQVMSGELGFAPAGITAFHGSPYAFTQFDKSKIGSNSGMDYGYGGYFAEGVDTAKGYVPNFMEKQAEARMFGSKNIDDAIKKAKEELSYVLKNKAPQSTVKEVQDEIALLESQKLGKKESGSLYKVDVPDEYLPKMINWSSSEQSPEVNKILKEAGLPTNIRGEDIYFAAIEKAGSSDAQKSGFQKASEYLDSIGIKGITYPQRSYDTDAITKNYVVFDPSSVKILERNNQPFEGLLGN